MVDFPRLEQLQQLPPIVFILGTMLLLVLVFKGQAEADYCKGYLRGLIKEAPCPSMECNGAFLYEFATPNEKMCDLARKSYAEKLAGEENG